MKSTLMSLKICCYYYPLKVLALDLWQVDPLLVENML